MMTRPDAKINQPKALFWSKETLELLEDVAVLDLTMYRNKSQFPRGNCGGSSCCSSLSATMNLHRLARSPKYAEAVAIMMREMICVMQQHLLM